VTALPRPLTGFGRGAQRWANWRARQRAAVMARCRGRCEAPGCYADAREAHHCFGRRHIIGEPLASHRTMLAGLCRECHRLVTVEPVCAVALTLQRAAIERPWAPPATSSGPWRGAASWTQCGRSQGYEQEREGRRPASARMPPC
jgi:hypothetical protein